MKLTFAAAMGGAELVDAYRIFPRFIVLFYLLGAASLIGWITVFYMNLPSVDKQSPVVAGFCAGVITAITGFGPWVFKIYNDSGRDWDAYHARIRAAVLSVPTLQPQ
jgi:hypothetical protein